MRRRYVRIGKDDNRPQHNGCHWSCTQGGPQRCDALERCGRAKGYRRKAPRGSRINGVLLALDVLTIALLVLAAGLLLFLFLW